MLALRRTLSGWLLWAVACSVVVRLPAELAAQTPAQTAATRYTPPRLADGRPDFSGFWTNNTATALQRPDAFKDREFLRPDEVAAFEKATVRVDEKRVKGAPCAVKVRPGAICPGNVGGAGSADVGDDNAVFLEDGRKVVSTLRTSILTDPKDGKMPAMTKEALAKSAADSAHQLEHPFRWP